MVYKRNDVVLREAARKTLVGLSNAFERLCINFAFVAGEVRKMVWVSRRAIHDFHSRNMCLDIIKVLLPTDAQEICFKTSIKIYIKTASTCFGAIAIIRERTISAC